MADPKFDEGELTSLRGKVIIVTGGSSGIGLATVELLLSLGAAVVSGDQHPPPAPQVIYPSAGADVAAFFTYVPTDVSVWADLVRLFQRAIQVHGRVDHVFANVGGDPSRERGDDYVMTSSLTLDANGELQEPCHTVLDVGLKGAINTTTLAMHHMRTQDPRGGSIVINGSITNLQDVGGVDHAVSKHGVLGFGLGLKNSSLDTASLSIRVNVLMPGRAERQVVEDIAAAAAREVAQLMADSTRDGHVVFAGEGQSSAIEEAVLLPAHR